MLPLKNFSEALDASPRPQTEKIDPNPRFAMIDSSHRVSILNDTTVNASTGAYWGDTRLA
jgi:hypothetical protein